MRPGSCGLSTGRRGGRPGGRKCRKFGLNSFRMDESSVCLPWDRMRKRKLKACVYCGEAAASVDHVIARCLLEKPYPKNLLTVPACEDCNRAYGSDEEYFLALMAQTGFVPTLMEKVDESGNVDRMLHHSEGLDTHFQEAMSVDETGRVRIQPNEPRIAKVAQKVAFGLYLDRYKPRRLPKLQDFFAVKPMHDRDPENFIITMAYTERFQKRRWTHFQTVCKDGCSVQVFDYMFVRNWVYLDFGRLFCIMRFHETIWAAVRCPNPSTRRTRQFPHSRPAGLQGNLFQG